MIIPKSSLLDSCIDRYKFLTQFLKNPTSVGAILPSSVGLAQEMSSEIPVDRAAKRRLILEIGPGTGNFTDAILEKMNPDDELHLVEYDEKFCHHLRDRYRHLSNVTIFHRSIVDYTSHTGEKYAFVISGLPLNGFRAHMVRKVFTKFRELTQENSKLSYFEYLFLPHVTRFLAPARDRKNVEAILREKEKFYAQHSLRTSLIFSNIPPARVLHHLVR